MNTRFILHGGINNETPQDDSNFFREILKNCPINPRILIVIFAKSYDRWNDTAARVKSEFNKIKGDLSLKIKVAGEEYFISEIKYSDIVFFCGGVSLNLLAKLQNYPELRSALRGKVVAGESAGTNVLCKFFYSPKADRISEGLGLVPAKLIPHYKDEYEGKLDNAGKEYELLTLPEYSFKVIDVEL